MQWVRVHAVLWWGLCAVFVDFSPLTHSLRRTSLCGAHIYMHGPVGSQAIRTVPSCPYVNCHCNLQILSRFFVSSLVRHALPMRLIISLRSMRIIPFLEVLLLACCVSSSSDPIAYRDSWCRSRFRMDLAHSHVLPTRHCTVTIHSCPHRSALLHTI